MSYEPRFGCFEIGDIVIAKIKQAFQENSTYSLRATSAKFEITLLTASGPFDNSLRCSRTEYVSC